MKGMNIDAVDLGWLAGLLEGEGSFMMSRNHSGGKVYLYPKIVVGMTDEDVIQRAANLFETKVYKLPLQSNRKPAWRAAITGARAAELMQMLLPHMGIRRGAKIQEILDEYGEIESTDIRRARACSESAKSRWAKYGTREGKL